MGAGGKRLKAGNPGYGIVSFLVKQVEKFSPLWWNEWEMAMKDESKETRRFAMEQFNKIQMKCMPQEIEWKDNTPRIELPQEDITLLTWLAHGLRERLKNQECLPNPKSLDTLETIASTDSSSLITSKQKKATT